MILNVQGSIWLIFRPLMNIQERYRNIDYSLRFENILFRNFWNTRIVLGVQWRSFVLCNRFYQINMDRSVYNRLLFHYGKRDKPTKNFLHASIIASAKSKSLVSNRTQIAQLSTSIVPLLLKSFLYFLMSFLSSSNLFFSKTKVTSCKKF